MTRTSTNQKLQPVRMWPKDLGVALVVLAALTTGWLLFRSVDGRITQFVDPDGFFGISYPASWLGTQSLQDVLLKVEDPLADSPFKSSLTVEERDLDLQNVPTIQSLLDRRVDQREVLTGYRFLGEQGTTVAGQKAIATEYAYVVQPIDQPRRASLPVVVRSREYIVMTAERVYYLTLAASQNEFAQASARFDRMLGTVEFK